MNFNTGFISTYIMWGEIRSTDCFNDPLHMAVTLQLMLKNMKHVLMIIITDYYYYYYCYY